MQTITEKDDGYDDWIELQVSKALAQVKANLTQGTDKDTVHARVMERVLNTSRKFP